MTLLVLQNAIPYAFFVQWISGGDLWNNVSVPIAYNCIGIRWSNASVCDYQA